MVEHTAHNGYSVGSNPTRLTYIKIIISLFFMLISLNNCKFIELEKFDFYINKKKKFNLILNGVVIDKYYDEDLNFHYAVVDCNLSSYVLVPYKYFSKIGFFFNEIEVENEFECTNYNLLTGLKASFKISKYYYSKNSNTNLNNSFFIGKLLSVFNKNLKFFNCFSYFLNINFSI